MKLCFRSDSVIKEINKFLRKEKEEFFTSTQLKALKDDVLGICYAHDEIGVRGMILAVNEEGFEHHKVVLLTSNYVFCRALLVDENFKPVKIVDRFDVVEHTFGDE